MAGYSSSRISGSSYLRDDGDIDDEEFLRRSNAASGYILNDGKNDLNRFSNYSQMSLEEQRQKILQKKMDLEQMSLKSTEKSLNSLRSTEEVGAATAEELYRQREQLERTEKRLDDINTTLRFSQRHIQGIKSVFGGLKNLIKGGGKPGNLPSTSSNAPASSTSNDYPESNTFTVVDRNNAQKKIVEDASSHPGLKIRGLYSEENSATDVKTQDIIDKNLDEMLNSIHRLKNLSFTLGDEIESQNELIDKVIDKAERADGSIHKQNKDIQKLLK